MWFKIIKINSVCLYSTAYQSLDAELRFCKLECTRENGENILIQGILDRFMYEVRSIFNIKY